MKFSLKLDLIDKIGTKAKRQITGYLYVAPAVIFLAAITIYPIINLIRLSVVEYALGQDNQPFIGLDNYIRMLSDEHLLNSLKNSFYFAGLGLIATLVLSLSLAMLLNSKWAPTGLRDSLRGILVLPWLFSPAVASLMWGLMLHRDGIINSYLMNLGLIESGINFLGNRSITLLVLTFIFVWKGYPFAMVMILAALNSVPQDIYEAAKVDGANAWQRFRSITLPIILPVILTISILRFVWGFGQYDLIRIITGGGPLRSTEVVSYYLFRVAFKQMDFSYSAAISVFVFVFLMVFGVIYVVIYSRSKPWK